MKKQNRQSSYKKKQCGFTLAEVLLVVVIIALIGGVGGGIYIGTYKKILVEKAARDFLLTAKYARIMAMEQQQPYEIQVDIASNKFSLVTSQLDEDTGQRNKVIVRDYYCRPAELSNDVKIENIQVAPVTSYSSTQADNENTIGFWPNGTADSTVIQIGDGKTHYTVNICSSTGKATMYFGTLENIQSDSVDLDTEQ